MTSEKCLGWHILLVSSKYYSLLKWSVKEKLCAMHDSLIQNGYQQGTDVFHNLLANPVATENNSIPVKDYKLVLP